MDPLTPVPVSLVAEKSKTLPKITLAINQLKKEIDKERGDRPACPDAVVKCLLQYPEPKAEAVKFRSVLDALDAISGSGECEECLFRALEKDALARFLVSNQRQFVYSIRDVAKAVGTDGLMMALSSLKNDDAARFFIQHPKQFVSTLSEIAKAVATENTHKDWLREMDYPFYRYASQLETFSAGKKLASSLGATSGDAEACLGFAYALDHIGAEKAAVIYKNFGIEYFGRYSNPQLEELYAHVGHKSAKPVLLAVYSKCDPHSSLFSEKDLVPLKKYYDVLIVEAGKESEFYGKLRSISSQYGKINALLICAHASSSEIVLGIPRLVHADETTLDFRDAKKFASVSDCFTTIPTVVLDCCHSGKDCASIGESLSRSWGAHLFAPELSDFVSSYVLDSSGRLSGVSYYSGHLHEFLGGIPAFLGNRPDSSQ